MWANLSCWNLQIFFTRNAAKIRPDSLGRPQRSPDSLELNLRKLLCNREGLVIEKKGREAEMAWEEGRDQEGGARPTATISQIG